MESHIRQALCRSIESSALNGPDDFANLMDQMTVALQGDSSTAARIMAKEMIFLKEWIHLDFPTLTMPCAYAHEEAIHAYTFICFLRATLANDPHPFGVASLLSSRLALFKYRYQLS
jgi:hypothetical protein